MHTPTDCAADVGAAGERCSPSPFARVKRLFHSLMVRVGLCSCCRCAGSPDVTEVSALAREWLEVLPPSSLATLTNRDLLRYDYLPNNQVSLSIEPHVVLALDLLMRTRAYRSKLHARDLVPKSDLVFVRPDGRPLELHGAA